MGFQIEKQTNADKIRQMSDEELAGYLCDRTSECYRYSLMVKPETVGQSTGMYDEDGRE